MSTADFVDLWAIGDNSFETDPPNAVLAFLEPDADAPDDAVVVLREPNFDPEARAATDATTGDLTGEAS